MAGRRFTILAALAAVLALPGTALAQGSAGDQQYADPFGNSDTGSSGGGHHSRPTHHSSSSPGSSSSGSSSSGSSSSGSSSSGSPAPAYTTPAATPAASSAAGTSSASSAAPASSSSSGTGAQTLPRTGFDAGWEAAAGGVLLLAGFALRRQTHTRPAHGRRR